jgi:phage terminase large subunit-like protein
LSWKQRQDAALLRYSAKVGQPWSWERPKEAGWTPWSDRSRRNVRWLEANCYVPDGPKAGERLRLTDHQMEKMRRIYQHEGSLPRLVVLSEARKNAKTAFASFIVLLHTMGPEAKPFQQVVTAARVKDQAAITFDYCVNSIQCSASLSPVVDVRKQRKEFEVRRIGTIYKALSRDAKAQLGKSPAVAIHDELGQVEGPTDELYNNIETAMKAHDAPMSVIVSTQAPKDGDLLSITIDDIVNNPRQEAVLFLSTAPMEPEEGVEESGVPPEKWAKPPDPDYPYSEEALLLANPEAGILCNLTELRRDASNAKRMPSLDASYRNLTLNQRIDQVSAFISKPIWNACGDSSLVLPGKDVRCFLGLDLSEVGDLTALAVCWETMEPRIPMDDDGREIPGAEPKDTSILNFWTESFLPAHEIRERSRRDRVPYDVWASKGQLTLVPGKAIDEDWVCTERVWPLWKRLTVPKAGFDRWGFKTFRKSLKAAGMSDATIDAKWEPIGMGSASMTPILKELESRVLRRTMRHAQQPVLTMAAANMVVQGPASARTPHKRTDRARIDPLVALLISLGAWLSTPRRNTSQDIHLL